MNQSRIEWTDFSINPVKGLCPTACPYCYARRMYKRFKWNPEIRYDPNAFNGLPEKPSRVFVGSTMELFGDWVERDWMHMIFAKILSQPRHTFIFLTKKPENLAREKFPENCWVGVTITDGDDDRLPLRHMINIEAKLKFISFEPLLNWWECARPEMIAKSLKIAGIGWIIIGAQTPYSPKTAPQVSWVKDIVEAADKAGCAVFLKENLESIFYYPLPEWAEDKVMNTRLRQEFPGCE